MQLRRVRPIVVTLSAAAVLAVAASLTIIPAYADTSAPPIFSINASDPSATRCYDFLTSKTGVCLFASRDIGSGSNQNNYYPMEETNMWFLPDGADPSQQNSWLPRGSSGSPKVLSESDYNWTSGNKHLWAPNMVYTGGIGVFFLLVPDEPKNKRHDVDSMIGVSEGNSPFGPFTPKRTLPISSYASDPSVYTIGGFPYLVYADGDWSTCGQISGVWINYEVSELMSTPQRITINNLPQEVKTGCQGGSGPYLEGPEIYQFNEGYDGYYLVFAVKKTNGNAREAIAYAWSDNLEGPYTWKGYLMDDSTTEWTNQASIVQLSNGNYLFFYHDGPDKINGQSPNRKIHAECLHFNGDGTIQKMTRTSTLSSCWND